MTADGRPDRYDREQVAERSATTIGFVDQLCELGMLVTSTRGRFTENDIRRTRIAQSLVDGGLPLTGLAEAIRAGYLDLGFVDAPAYDRFAGLSNTSFRAAAATFGVPIEIALAIREASGSAAATADDLMRPSEMEALPALAMELLNGVRPAVVERALRAVGESARRMAEVEADWWMTDVIGPILAEGGTPVEIMRRTGRFSDEFSAVEDQLILGLYHGQQAHSWMKNIFEGFEMALVRAGLHAPTDRPPAICFLDVSGYTRLTEERGDAAAAELAGRLGRLVQRTSAQHGGKPIKWLGDGVMFHFREPGPSVLAALEMVEGAGEAQLPPAHVGIHAGPVLFQEGDYFGRTVNLAARIADYARRGEVLVTDEVVRASDIAGVAFEPIGPVELKGLSEAIPLNVARRTA
jgi:adenylate cyclase